ncbi:helix-turn-helix transcriptional regulator [Glaesserella parasuis]|uniref:helix-turn-helix transcriptional regulator n=1 Tax=Glaesserella parasuis TaxID=738 RepID=UPI0002CAB726|nr:WYL domain-containing protein [Glaesserella parasuis]EMY45860.1 transcriptional regulator-like protein, helix-turn-helix domain-containing protein [Glaesserella parasuis gx033]MDG6325279.1 WYL domain-containing protein [Glaesserella parasuis]MDG6454706.1 WYL domain-containing protein [Glaesserella parasuis]MDG6457190.1 WYL domain-containing protein [Glaesserella parasuis]MDG6480657.1 WYL domain-containing protein [Glaesserella parasuis]
MQKNTVLAQRLSEILSQLNQGKRIDINQLAEDFGVSVRTIQRDIKDRLAFLEWEESGPRHYKINRYKLGILSQQDISRFALFASISDLFPKVDRDFYQEKLTDSVKVKGFQYEDIRHLDNEFQLIKQAIEAHKFIDFLYKKNGQIDGKFYKIAPYSLINKNGIWYLIGTDEDKQKTFCFTQITMLKMLDETFEPNQQLQEEIKSNDSISFGNQLSEVLVKVSSFASPYFLRRNLLPNQKLVHKSENGELILASENVNELDIVPLVQYWIPHLTIISPNGLQEKMVEKLKQYIAND